MAQRSGSGARTRPGLLGSLAVAVATVALTAGTMTAATGAPTSTVAEVQRSVERLRHEAEVASERYNETRERLSSLKVRMRAAKTRMARQRTEIATAKQSIGRIAAETYQRGSLSTLDYLLSDDPEAVLAQAGLVPTLGERRAGALRRLEASQRALTTEEAALQRQLADVASAQADMQASRRTVLQRLAQAEAQLGRLRAAERAAVERGGTSISDPGDAGPGGRTACRDTMVNAPTGRVKKVLEYACAQLGDPYEWAGEGPNTWDCSGLTMKAWAQAGVSLPHSSKMQAEHGTRVSNSSLRAGDLVFFHSPISHVGIYLGNGTMLHAPQSGDVVKVAAMNRTPTAAVRL